MKQVSYNQLYTHLDDDKENIQGILLRDYGQM